MATKKRKSVQHKMIDQDMQELVAPQPMAQPSTDFVPAWRQPKVFIPVLLLVLLGAFFTMNKGLLVAAIVDGRPIWRWDLNNVMTSRYGQQTLEGIISEQMIFSEAQKAGVTVSASEIQAKEAEILKGLGKNVSIDDLLKYQGVSRADFDNQLKVQLAVQKLLGKDIQITDDDVNNYIATNRAMLSATEEGALKAEARQAILDAKIGEKVQPWFTALKEKAKILRFL